MKVFQKNLSLRFSIFLFLTLFTSLVSFGQSEGQGWEGTRTKLLQPGIDSMLIDSLPVVLSTVRLLNSRGEISQLPFKTSGETRSYIIFEKKIQDSLYLKYSVIPIDLNQTFQNKDTSLLLPEITSFRNNTYEVGSNKAFKPFEGLNSKGSISRAISIGSNQDAVLNSTLNLQLSGKISKETEIRASITDNSIPVQSDGYSQQLREFDRVYIELENKDFGLLRAGDYNVIGQDNYFLRFDKRVSGAGIYSQINLDKGSIPIQAEGGIARGRFTRNRFAGQEGNQGPYKLIGANGELFVIIISGSEKVYIDGVLMKRGQQFDYVMDYNAGEITFTSLQPITKEKRIVVEFQYTEQNYLRSVVFGKTGFRSERFKTQIQFYSEQDSKNQSLVQDLTDAEKNVLSNAGDNLDAAAISTIRASNFDESLILYQLRDSLGFDSVLVFSSDTSQQLYQASFSFVGANQGDYNLSQNNANGRVFQWVAPVAGIPQGSYSPVKQLIAPNQLQIFTFQTEAKISEFQDLKVDLAISKNDINLFSDFGKGNDIGGAGKLLYSIKGKMAKLDWFSRIRFEFNQDNFRTIERIRRVEFARDWNLPLNYNGATQISGVQLGLKKNENVLSYNFDFLNITAYQGYKNELNSIYRNTKNSLRLNASWLSTRDSINNSNFAREQLDYQYNFTPKFWAGVKSIGELNRQKQNGTDTLLQRSYSFLQNEFFLGYGDTSKNYIQLYYINRLDDTASQGRLQNFSQANTYGLRSSLKTNFNSRLQVFVYSRNLKIFLPEERDIETTINSRLNYIQRFFKNAIISTTFYETGAGSEARRQFSYVEVPAGTGVYTHTDYNGNGLMELDEFEIAPNPDQAKFIRVFTPSNVYVRTNINKFGQNLNINAPYSWKNEEGLKSKLAYFSLLLNYQLDRKTLLEGNSNSLNPFEAVNNDTLIVALNNSIRATTFFNRSSSIFGVDYTYLVSDNRNLLSFGVEKRASTENSANLRYRFMEPVMFRTTFKLIEKSNESQNFASRNFIINEIGNSYSLSYQTNDKLLLTASYEWNTQEGLSDVNANLDQQDLGLSFNYNLAESITLQSQLNYILNRFDGDVNTPVAFDMLDGLRPGKNGTWNLSMQKTIRKNILVSLSYNGRISEGSIPINTGNLQVKAFF